MHAGGTLSLVVPLPVGSFSRKPKACVVSSSTLARARPVQARMWKTFQVTKTRRARDAHACGLRLNEDTPPLDQRRCDSKASSESPLPACRLCRD